MSSMIAIAVLFELLLFAGCSGAKLPDTRYYQLATPTSEKTGGDLTLVLEPLATDQAYDDERIVYRATPYRLDYYQYHRWSAAPGAMIGNFLEQSLEHSGRFRNVTRDASPDAPAVLGGRVVAIEEVDMAKGHWVGRIVVELTLTEAKTQRVLWTEQFEETEPLQNQNPEGLARALSAAMERIALKAGPQIEHYAQASAMASAR
jgi:ABC-type uncharacterized transport system auxiliary subunit